MLIVAAACRSGHRVDNGKPQLILPTLRDCLLFRYVGHTELLPTLLICLYLTKWVGLGLAPSCESGMSLLVSCMPCNVNQ